MTRVFLSYSHADAEPARDLVNRLRQAGLDVWFDEDEVLPGQLWEYEIRHAIRNATFVIILLSLRSISRTGYAQKEIRLALEAMQRMPEGRPYAIPVRLDDCAIPDHLEHLHCGRLQNDADFAQLVRILRNNNEANEYGIVSDATQTSVPTHAEFLKMQAAEMFNMDRPIDRTEALRVINHYERLAAEVDRDATHIIPGQGASLIHVGAQAYDLRTKLPDATFASYDNAKVAFFSSKSRGVSVRIDILENIITSIFLYRDGVDGYSGYRGVTPEGISVNCSRGDVEQMYGLPTYAEWRGARNDEYEANYYSHGLIFQYFASPRVPSHALIKYMVVIAPPQPSHWKLIDQQHEFLRKLRQA